MRWLQANPQIRLPSLAYYGYVEPNNLGIAHSGPASSIPGNENPQYIPGWHIVSVNFLKGCSWKVFDGKGSALFLEQDALKDHQKLSPITQIGYSILVFYVGETPAADSKAKLQE